MVRALVTKEKLARINFLANKSKTEGLTNAERKEQQQLRTEYLQGFKKSFTDQITNVTVIDPEGNDVTPKKVKEMKKKNKNNNFLH